MDFAFSKVKDEIVAKVVPLIGIVAVHSWCKGGKFHATDAYNWFRTKGTEVYWYKALQGQGIIPSHRVITGFAAANTLPMVDKLITRGIAIVNRCVLCHCQAESHRHVFFRCSFSQELWRALLQWMNNSGRSDDLRTELKWIVNARGRKHWKIEWRKSCLAAAVYFLWKERNMRIFVGQEYTVRQIVSQIKFVTKIKLSCMSVSRCPLREVRLLA
ncbi:uncharacterized protein LOC141651434 [Silene latifolia]|uniref:uncharacterized protein LOC141651434 n=1 Tax=Silene latifolia TaxID=37657 RepID=UPI003D76D3F3